MRKKIIVTILAAMLCFALPMTAMAKSEYYDYQQAILTLCNEQHNGQALVLDPRLCALAAKLAMEQEGYKTMTAYRPNKDKWSSIFEENGYRTEPASSGCNWLKTTKADLTAKEIVDYWMNTDGFKENVRSSMFTHTGVYAYYSQKYKCYYIVQLFTKPTAEQAATSVAGTLAVSTGRVNMRSGPSTSYKSLGKLSLRQIVEVESIVDGEWARLINKGFTVYVSMSYLKLVTTAKIKTPESIPSTDPGTIGTAVATGGVNIRSGPGTDYSKLGKLKKGQTVVVWSIDGKWAEITLSASYRGFVHTDYLRLEMKNDMNLYTLLKSIAPGFEEATSFAYRVAGTDSKKVAQTNNITMAKNYLADVVVTGYEKSGPNSGWTKMIAVSYENRVICSFYALGSQGAVISVSDATYQIQCEEDVFAKLVELLQYS